MPKTSRPPEEVEIVKEKILETALQMLIHDGFNSMSMRKLASRLNMTAANIYNYYSGKDELYLMIQTRGFELLHEELLARYEGHDNPADRGRAMIRAYITFGIGNQNYYDIMFNQNTPKYADYVGTEIEPVAFHEKQTALKSFHITAQVLTELFEAGGKKSLSGGEIGYRTVRLWCDLHGIVSLYNSRVLQEVEESTGQVIDRMVNDIIESYLHEAMG